MRASTWNLISYLFGAFLVVVGILRAKYLGAPRQLRVDERDTGDAEPPAGAPTPAAPGEPPRIERGPVEKRHLRWGLLYVLMGLFLVISTYLQMRRQTR
jgi:hypothetical protein